MNRQLVLPVICRHNFIYPSENGDDVLIGVCKYCGANQESISARGLTHLYTKQKGEYDRRGAANLIKNMATSIIYEDDKIR